MATTITRRVGTSAITDGSTKYAATSGGLDAWGGSWLKSWGLAWDLGGAYLSPSIDVTRRVTANAVEDSTLRIVATPIVSTTSRVTGAITESSTKRVAGV